MLCQVFAGRQRAFVGRRGVERRATVRISVVGVTGARCGFVIDWWAFPRATVHQGHSMNNGKRPNQSDIARRSCASRPNKTDSQAQRCARLAGISGGNGGELSTGIFSRSPSRLSFLCSARRTQIRREGHSSQFATPSAPAAQTFPLPTKPLLKAGLSA
jgi:hypothetical protein